MEDIRIYDFEFNLLHIEHDIISSNWTLSYNDVGTFEGHFNPSSEIVSYVLNNPYLVVVQGDKQAIVTGKQATSECVVYGRTPNWILQKRTIDKFTLSDVDAESVARYAVSNSFNEADDQMYLGDIVGFTTTQTFERSNRSVVFDVVQEALEGDKGGHTVNFDIPNKRWVFQARKGTESSLLISAANKNAYDTNYTEDCQEYISEGWYEKEVEDEEGTAQKVWTKIVGAERTGIYRWEGSLSGSVESEARADLDKRVWEKQMTTKTRGLKYGEDYQLGDTVRIQKEIGDFKATFTKRIIGVNLWYENNNVGEEPIFEEE